MLRSLGLNLVTMILLIKRELTPSSGALRSVIGEGRLLHLTHHQRSALSFRDHSHAMSSTLRPLKAFYDTFGIASIQETGRNAYIIILARSLRMFAYGTNNLILGEIATLERVQK
jgi:hypothetical protein